MTTPRHIKHEKEKIMKTYGSDLGNVTRRESRAMGKTYTAEDAHAFLFALNGVQKETPQARAERFFANEEYRAECLRVNTIGDEITIYKIATSTFFRLTAKEQGILLDNQQRVKNTPAGRKLLAQLVKDGKASIYLTIPDFVIALAPFWQECRKNWGYALERYLFGKPEYSRSLNDGEGFQLKTTLITYRVEPHKKYSVGYSKGASTANGIS